MLLVSLLCCSLSQAGEWVSETQSTAPDAELCQGVCHWLKNLPERCARDALESYPKFRSPPWEKLDPNQHMALLIQLMENRYGPPMKPVSDLEPFRNRASAFIQRRGELYVWRTRLMSNYGGGIESEIPPGQQTIVVMADNLGAVDTSGTCPGQHTKGWAYSTFVVLPDLSGLDPKVEHSLAHALALMQPVQSGGETLLIGNEMAYRKDGKVSDGAAASVWRDFDRAGLSAACSFRFSGKDPAHKKGK